MTIRLDKQIDNTARVSGVDFRTSAGNDADVQNDDFDARPTLQRLADHKLNGKLEDFVRTRRADGRSWRLIARDIWQATDVDVTYETLRGWFPDESSEPAA